MAVERKFNNSAIGSWAGYIYQGLCAVYVVLHYFHDVVNNPELRDKYGKYILYLDSYDDFSIHDGANIAISLHQCKLYKNKNSFSEALEQMKGLYKKLKENLICTDTTNLYFHSNHSISDEEVKNYKDFQENKTWTGEELDTSISQLVKVITQKGEFQYPSFRICARLYWFVDKRVIALHNEYLKDERRKLVDIVRDKAAGILFEEIFKLFDTDDLCLVESDEYAHLLKFHMISAMKRIIDENNDPADWEEQDLILAPECVHKLIELIMQQELKNFPTIVQRLMPGLPYNKHQEHLKESTNEPILRELMSTVGFCKLPLEDSFVWVKDCMFHAPITIALSNARQICRKLYNNRANLDCLNECDYLIVNHRIGKEMDCSIVMRNIIGDKYEGDPRSIFNSKKIGLMDIKEFNKI